MPVFGRLNVLPAALFLLASGVPTISASVDAQTLPTAPLSDADFQDQQPAELIVAAPAETPVPLADASDPQALDPEIECMAKVVYHEAANQPRQGQLAVAQTIMHRIASGRFADTPCGVANQKGQFFQTSSYDPPRGNAAWAMAVEVARAAHDGTEADVAQGAMFFQAAHSRGFRARERVATIGNHVFYR